MAEGSYWSNEFSCPTIAAFLQESVCENTEDVAGGENSYSTRLTTELALDGRRNMDNKQQGDAATPTAPPTSNAYQLPRVATRPEGYRQPTTGAVPRLETVAKTAWHHSSYHCVRLVLVTINSSMQYATTQRQGPPAYIIGTDTGLIAASVSLHILSVYSYCCIKESLLCN